jgi:acyl-CoA dehydrogenase
MDDLLTDALKQLLDDQCTPDTVRRIEAGESAAALWSQLEESGFADAMLAEDQGGAGLSLAGAFPLFELCGACAVPVPLAHTMLARAVLASAGVQRPQGSIAIACGTVAPLGRVADWVLTCFNDRTLLLPVAQAKRSDAVFPLDATLQWSDTAMAQATHVPGKHDLETLQACVAAAQIAGALMNVFQRTLQYANERQQFGRPIGKFQAIQHQLAVASEHTFAARMAAQIGCSAKGHVPERLRVAVAKARASESVVEVAALSHAIHGAIGFTAEYDLQLYTRRLHAWRREAGSQSYWQDVLGEALVAREGLTLDLIRQIADVHIAHVEPDHHEAVNAFVEERAPKFS